MEYAQANVEVAWAQRGATGEVYEKQAIFLIDGHEGIREAVIEILYPVWRETHHLTSNLRLSFSDPDHAHGVCNVDCMGATVDDIVQMISATYTDDFERRNGTWKITKRHVVIHYFNPIPGAEMSAPAA